MKIIIALFLCIVWLGFISVPAVNGIRMLIDGIHQILEVPSCLPEYRKSELFLGIGTVLYSLFLMSLSVILALCPFFDQF